MVLPTDARACVAVAAAAPAPDATTRSRSTARSPTCCAACAAPRRDEPGTWLVPSMMRAYQRLHDAGAAHSIEVWIDGELAGGLYGVALGRMFFGESMFTRRTDGSKIAIVAARAQLARWEFPLIDCQMRTTIWRRSARVRFRAASSCGGRARSCEQPGVPGAVGAGRRPSSPRLR